ncbi:MAG: aminotransferase class IV [Peptococcaceae bacterium]|nr:aminotransferase class IV [Peptococcaceae bacterium]
MSQELAWINGTITPVEEARVPFLDHGYFFGYGVYEAMRTYGGRLFAFQEHFDRLEKSMELLRLSIDLSRSDMEKVLGDLIARSNLQPETLVYLQITRGPALRRMVRPDTKPVVSIFTSQLDPVPEELRRQGVKAITMPDQRWQRPDIKSLNLLPNVLARVQAEEEGAHEAIFYKSEQTGTNKSVTEGAMSNVFAVFGGAVVTPPADGQILAGVTRLKVMQSAAAHGVNIVEKHFTIEELRGADEIFISSTGTEALGVSVLDDQEIGDGKAGPLSLQIAEWFLEDCLLQGRG